MELTVLRWKRRQFPFDTFGVAPHKDSSRIAEGVGEVLSCLLANERIEGVMLKTERTGASDKNNGCQHDVCRESVEGDGERVVYTRDTPQVIRLPRTPSWM